MRFVGRGKELLALRAEADLARSSTRVVLVVGDSGIGKSRLLEEFRRGLPPDYRAARSSFAVPIDAAPLWTWRSVLSDLGVQPPPRAGTASSFSLRLAYASAVVEATRPGPTVVILDDLHLADVPSRALLAHLAATQAAPLLVVAAYRDDHATALPAGPTITRMVLRGLTAEDTADLLADLLGTQVAPALVAQLHRRTDGNPYLLGEVVAQLDPAGPDVDPTGRVMIYWPERVRVVVEQRLAAVTDETCQLLGAAAVLGREFDLALLEHITQGWDLDVVDALDEAMRHHLIVARPEHVFRFVRSIDRELLYDGHGARERAQLHEAAAQALLSFGALVGERGPTAAELAHHLGNAAMLGGTERLDLAIAYAVAAATHASDQHRVHDAVAHHQAALQLAIRAGWDQAMLGRLIVGVGAARAAAGQVDAARESLDAAARLARSTGDPDLLAATALAYGPRASVGDTAPPPDAELVTLLTEAIAAHQKTTDPGPTLARLHARLAVELLGMAGAEHHARFAVETANACGDMRAAAEATIAQTYIGADSATPAGTSSDDSTIVDLRPATRTAIALGDEVTECRARLAIAAKALETGDVVGADRELAIVATAHRHPYSVWYAMQAEAHRAMLAGDLIEATSLAEQAHRLGQRVSPVAAALAHTALESTLALARGTAGELAPALAGLGRGASPPDWLTALSALVAVNRGEVAVAAALVGELLAEGAEKLGRWCLVLLAEVVAELRDPQWASSIAALLTPYARGWTVIGPAVASGGPVGIPLAHLHLLMGDRQASRTALDAAAATVGTTVWAPQVRLARARWHAARGHAHDTAAALSEARATRLGAVERGLTGVAARADDLMGSLAKDSGAGLTRREQEVAALALRGMPTREIAAALRVSERTAETHLANIYRKFNVRSRVELIARFGSQGR